MPLVAVDPTTVTNPPRGTDPAELREAADMLAAGQFVSNGETYAEKSEAVKAASTLVRGIKWLGRDDIRPGARYHQRPDDTFTFYIKDLGVDSDETEIDDEDEAEAPAKGK